MPIIESEVFKEYVKQSKSEGLVKEADYSEARIGSDNDDAISLLYGIKPNGKKDDKSIVEKAHPETAVVGPAYDAMNAIVENVQQRQNMMAYIAHKTPSGDLTMHRYVKAKSELIDSIVRAGFELDNDNNVDLMKFADQCVGDVTKQAGYWIPIAGAALALLGTVAWINNTDDVVQNIYANSERVISELEDIQEEFPKVSYIIKDLRNLQAKYEKYVPAKQNLSVLVYGVGSADDLVAIAAESKDNIVVIKDYVNELQKVKPKLIRFASMLNSMPQKEWTYDWLAKLDEVRKYIVPDDYKDVILSINGLVSAIDVSLKNARQAMNIAFRYSHQINDAAKNVEEGNVGSFVNEYEV